MLISYALVDDKVNFFITLWWMAMLTS